MSNGNHVDDLYKLTWGLGAEPATSEYARLAPGRARDALAACWRAAAARIGVATRGASVERARRGARAVW